MPSSTDFEPVTSKAETIRNLGGSMDTHDAILQFLNRVIGDLYFPLESFTSTADQWNGIPIVFAKVHPDLKAFDEDRERELKRIGGRIVGQILHPHIVTVGHPRLMGQLMFTDDGQCSQYILKGTLSLSTGFWCRTNRSVSPATLTGIVKPNHVLVFVEDLSNQPKDQGSIILNKEERKYCGLKKKTSQSNQAEMAGETVEGNTGNEPIDNKGKVLSSANRSRFEKVMSKLKQIFGQHEEAIKDMEGVLAEMTAERSDVNGDYQSIMPPTGNTDQPEAFAAGKQPVKNDMLKDAVGYPPVSGMGDQTSMKQKAETPIPEKTENGEDSAMPKDEAKEDEMDAEMKQKLTDMGFKVDDKAGFITQLNQLMEDKKALEERVNCVTKELGEYKAQKQQAEEDTKKLEEAEKKEEEAEVEEEKAMKQKIEDLTQKVQDLKFEQMVNKLPKGKSPKSDAERKELRQKWDTDPEAVMNMIIDSAKGFKPSTKEEGLTVTGTPQERESAFEAIKNKKTRGIGAWDPYANNGKGGYVD